MYFLDNFSLKRVGVSFLIILTILLSSPKPAFAGAVVWDPGNYVPNYGSFVADGSLVAKEFGLDALAWFAANLVIKKMAAQTVNWINSGFKGSPAYVTDPDQFFLNVADQTASRFLSSPGLNQLCSPFSAQVRLALVRNYLYPYDGSYGYTCTLSILQNNFESFLNDFEQGGWDGWFEVTQNDSNNPYGAYLKAQNSLYAQISAANNRYITQLQQGRGFLSFEKCQPGYEVTQAMIDSAGPIDDSNPLAGYKAGDCLDNKVEVVTPGSVIESQLNTTLGSGLRRIEAADEIDEIISALLNQLIGKVVGGTTGLLGMNRTSSSGTSFASQLGTENENNPSDSGDRIVCTTLPDTIDEFGNVIAGQTDCQMKEPDAPPPTLPDDKVYCTPDGNGGYVCGGNQPPPPSGGTTGTPSWEPASLIADISAARSRYGATLTETELSELLISVASQHSGWGLLSKASGTTCSSPFGSVACDTLYHNPSCLTYDVLIDSDPLTGAATPTWRWSGLETDRSRWVDVGAGGASTGPCATLVGGSTGGTGGTGGGTPPSSLLADLQAERAKYGSTMTSAELGDLLNTVAWNNKDAGWGLSFKNRGTYCNSPAGTIACDILYHQPTNTLYDVLIDAGGASAPTWNMLGPNTDSSRPWVAPVQS